MKNKDKSKSINRRQFLKKATVVAAGTALPYFVPSSVLGADATVPPSDKLNIGMIGMGCMGIHDAMTFLQEPDVQIVAVCDVNKGSSGYIDWAAGDTSGLGGQEPARKVVEEYYAQQRSAGTYKGCDTYGDFRKMIERDDIDAVIVVTPDHWHAAITMAAIKKGKHVYCQKPLTRTVYEARIIAQAAKMAGVATQMGNANQASEGPRILREWIADGAIGQVHEVKIWSNRPLKWTPGLVRPKETPPVPASLDWDMWLGPAPQRPYHPCYQPYVWRGWWDFGTGALGDMGCYCFEPITRALKLEHPISVQAHATKELSTESTPHACIVRYEFGARGSMPPVKVSWYDGGLKFERPEELEEGRSLGDRHGGVLFIGDKGKILCNFTCTSPRIIPEAKMKAYEQPPKTIPRSVGHHKEWVRACKGGEPAASNFERSGFVTEVVMLGNVAIRVPDRVLKWDSKDLKLTNAPEANKYIKSTYRAPWTL